MAFSTRNRLFRAPCVIASWAFVLVLLQDSYRSQAGTIVGARMRTAFLPGEDDVGNTNRFAPDCPAMLIRLTLFDLQFATSFAS